MLYGKVLIVDDESEILKLLELELSSEGYIVVKAKTGKEAIMQAKTSLPDLIVMDIMMPGMDGAQAVKILKSDIKTKNIPIVFLTAILTKREEKLQQMGVAIDGAYYPTIAKPFDSRELLMTINKVMYNNTKMVNK